MVFICSKHVSEANLRWHMLRIEEIVQITLLNLGNKEILSTLL